MKTGKILVLFLATLMMLIPHTNVYASSEAYDEVLYPAVKDKGADSVAEGFN